MILTGAAITLAVEANQIVIDPFNLGQVGPNSYDFRLGDRCRVYLSEELDCALENPSEVFEIKPTGLLLSPKRVYLINTLERMGSKHFVPIIRGRSSVGRLGIFINITADLIDIGSINQWTLQLHAIAPVRVYPGMLIGQVTFWVPEGPIDLYTGKYGTLPSPVASLSYLEFSGSER
jgi:dCTP deaminase